MAQSKNNQARGKKVAKKTTRAKNNGGGAQISRRSTTTKGKRKIVISRMMMQDSDEEEDDREELAAHQVSEMVADAHEQDEIAIAEAASSPSSTPKKPATQAKNKSRMPKSPSSGYGFSSKVGDKKRMVAKNHEKYCLLKGFNFSKEFSMANAHRCGGKYQNVLLICLDTEAGVVRHFGSGRWDAKKLCGAPYLCDYAELGKYMHGLFPFSEELVHGLRPSKSDDDMDVYMCDVFKNITCSVINAKSYLAFLADLVSVGYLIVHEEKHCALWKQLCDFALAEDKQADFSDFAVKEQATEETDDDEPRATAVASASSSSDHTMVDQNAEGSDDSPRASVFDITHIGPIMTDLVQMQTNDANKNIMRCMMKRHAALHHLSIHNDMLHVVLKRFDQYMLEIKALKPHAYMSFTTYPYNIKAYMFVHFTNFERGSTYFNDSSDDENGASATAQDFVLPDF